MPSIPFEPLDPLQVMCPSCRADGGEPCLGAGSRPMASVHTERKEWAADLNARAMAPTAQGRWYRHHFRQGNIPRPVQPHGTWAAYKRHLKAGEPPCEACAKAPAEQRRNRKSRQ